MGCFGSKPTPPISTPPAPTPPTPTPPTPTPPETQPVRRRHDKHAPLSASQLVVAIDFGTTYSGVAWSYFSASTRRETGLELNSQALNSQTVVYQGWPGVQGADKIPTVISYSNTPPKWGAMIKRGSQDRRKVSRFKLGLDPEKVREVFGQNSGDGVIGLNPKLNKNAFEVTADFLTQLNHHIHNVAFPANYGEEFLANQAITYVVTVPAIWSDAAKDLTRRAMEKAGIPGNNLILVTEPEAAALYCATAGNQFDLKEGDSFIVCDAGGGTVVRGASWQWLS
jgi:molecular chaperone DnaK (HSP70)